MRSDKLRLSDIKPEDREKWEKIRLTGLIQYRNRKGNPISLRSWANGYEDRRHQVLARDVIGDVWVSTIWTGHCENGDTLGLFETKVFYTKRERGGWLRRSVPRQAYHELHRRHRTELAAYRWHYFVRRLLRVIKRYDGGPPKLAINGGPSSVCRTRT